MDTVVAQAGFDRIEMGTDATEHGFMNVAIFEGIHFANAVVVDVTGLRPNCFIELGYALRATRVIVTAEEGTTLPFDQNAIPCYFWREDEPDNKRQDALSEFWRKNIDRPTIVQESLAGSDMNKEVFISVDIEASGPVPGTYSMLALGACVVTNSQEQFYVELRPLNAASLPAAMKVVGRTLRYFERAGREPAEAMAGFRDWLKRTSRARQTRIRRLQCYIRLGICQLVFSNIPGGQSVWCGWIGY